MSVCIAVTAVQKVGDESAKLEGPKLEARRAESGSGVLGQGAASPLPPARGSGERCKFPSGVWCGAPKKIRFGCILGLNFAS